MLETANDIYMSQVRASLRTWVRVCIPRGDCAYQHMSRLKTMARSLMTMPTGEGIEVAGPEHFRFDDFIRQGLKALEDLRDVVADPKASYFGALLGERTLEPDEDFRVSLIRFTDWLRSKSLMGPSARPELAWIRMTIANRWKLSGVLYRGSPSTDVR